MNQSLSQFACGVVAAVFVALCLNSSVLTTLAEAQETIIFELNRAAVAWDIVPPADGVSWADQYVLTCTSPALPAAVTGSVAHPANSIPLLGIVPGRGTYTCTVRAENRAGASPESATVAFGVGGRPREVGNVRIQVQ